MSALIFLTLWRKSRFLRSNGGKISINSQNSGDQNEVITRIILDGKHVVTDVEELYTIWVVLCFLWAFY